ncbi:MAG TPA: sigma-70 family RNA polymerase sigma factor [Woeseiaceae bacterium]|nr:sigma-70 family RNA polymerase sigma factor [Woeseiaceae bacterium]
MDTHAFGELVRRHQSRIRNFLRRLARDPDLADDLAQDCFVHAWDRLHTFSGSGSFVGWLMKIAYTTFLQAKRRSSRYSRVLDSVREEPAPVSVQASEEAGDLDKLLAVLTAEERAVMIMSYAAGMSHREIGEATNLPVGTVKSIIYRGKEKIRERFDIEHHKAG